MGHLEKVLGVVGLGLAVSCAPAAPNTAISPAFPTVGAETPTPASIKPPVTLTPAARPNLAPTVAPTINKLFPHPENIEENQKAVNRLVDNYCRAMHCATAQLAQTIQFVPNVSPFPVEAGLSNPDNLQPTVRIHDNAFTEVASPAEFYANFFYADVVPRDLSQDKDLLTVLKTQYNYPQVQYIYGEGFAIIVVTKNEIIHVDGLEWGAGQAIASSLDPSASDLNPVASTTFRRLMGKNLTDNQFNQLAYDWISKVHREGKGYDLMQRIFQNDVFLKTIGKGQPTKADLAKGQLTLAGIFNEILLGHIKDPNQAIREFEERMTDNKISDLALPDISVSSYKPPRGAAADALTLKRQGYSASPAKPDSKPSHRSSKRETPVFQKQKVVFHTVPNPTL